jgi:hypothetical protein
MFFCHYHLYPMLNQNFGDHRFKDDCEQETAMTQQLKHSTWTDISREKLGLFQGMINALVVWGTMWEAVG